MDDQKLDQSVEFFLDNTIAQSTMKYYGLAKKCYISFCHARHIPPLPASQQELCRYVAHLANEGLSHTTLWAAVSLCICSFLRSGEITVSLDSAFDETRHLAFEDIAVDQLTNPTSLRVRLKVSKTDPFRTGVYIFVGRTGCTLCPVMAMMDYLVTTGAGPGPLFIYMDHYSSSRTGSH